MEEDNERDNRIAMEIIVDSYDSEEQFSSWHSYLEDTLAFPFEASWKTTPDGKSKKVIVIGMGDFDYCLDARDMLVNIDYEGDELFEPLNDLFDIKSNDEKTKEAIEDWNYWSESGNVFENEDDSEEDDE
ncbi:MAG: calcium-binding protein [Cyanobacteriota bacterium]